AEREWRIGCQRIAGGFVEFFGAGEQVVWRATTLGLTEVTAAPGRVVADVDEVVLDVREFGADVGVVAAPTEHRLVETADEIDVGRSSRTYGPHGFGDVRLEDRHEPRDALDELFDDDIGLVQTDLRARRAVT